MLRPEEPITKIEGLPVGIIMSLERIGIKFVIQLITMTESQIFCVKGIEEPELRTIIKVLASNGFRLSKNPLNIVMTAGENVCMGRVAPIEMTERQDGSPAKVGVSANVNTGKIEVSFPPRVGMVAFRPQDAIGLSELIAKKARTLMN